MRLKTFTGVIFSNRMEFRISEYAHARGWGNLSLSQLMVLQEEREAKALCLSDLLNHWTEDQTEATHLCDLHGYHYNTRHLVREFSLAGVQLSCHWDREGIPHRRSTSDVVFWEPLLLEVPSTDGQQDDEVMEDEPLQVDDSW